MTDFVDEESHFSEQQEENAEEEPPLISLHAITGRRIGDTMQVRITIGSHAFTALIDSGSTHNFVSREVAQKTGLTCSAGSGSSVVVVNGDRVTCSGVARDVNICIGHDCFNIDCHSIPLDYYDIVLGVQFLHTLGTILMDFDDLCMSFTHQGHSVFWKGIGSTQPHSSPTGHLHSMIHSENALPEQLLIDYAPVFEAPIGLPPAHACDHRIHLKPLTETTGC